MRTAWFVLVVSCVLSAHGTGDAEPFRSVVQEASPESPGNTTGHTQEGEGGNSNSATEPLLNRTPSREEHNRYSLHKGRSINRANPLPASRPRQLQNRSHTPTAFGDAADKSARSIGSAAIPEQAINKPRLGRLNPRANVPSVNVVRHRGPNPPVTGGSTLSKVRNTAAINGTRVYRKPQ